jgi:hypothetical protein
MTHLSYTHLMCRVAQLHVVAPHTLRIVFDDATKQAVSFEPILRGELYGPLRDPRLFSQAALDTQAGTLVWPNGADFDPATLHDWAQCQAAFVAMASRWEPSPA